jgi:hypothetical protein
MDSERTTLLDVTQSDSVRGFMPQTPKRFISRRDLHIIHFACHERRPIAGARRTLGLQEEISL